MEHHPADEVEEVNYGSSSPEEIYQHENNCDFDWDQDCFIYDYTKKIVECIVLYFINCHLSLYDLMWPPLMLNNIQLIH